MRKRGYASGFALADLVMPAAVLTLLICIGSWIYSRHFQKAYESRTREMIAEVLECDPDEVLSEVSLAKVRQRAAPRAERPLAAVVEARKSETPEADTPPEDGEKSAATPPPAQERAKRVARRSMSRNRDVDAAMAGPGDVRGMMRPQAICDAYDRRCQAILEDMR